MSDQDERIEELETQVERLKATVQGLTEELVEVHDRLETLEGSGSTAGQRDRTGESGKESQDVSRARDEENDEAKSDETQKKDETGGDSDVGDDIIVA